MGRRVVITGMGLTSALGDSPEAAFARLKRLENCVRFMPEWERYKGLHTKLAAPHDSFDKPDHYGRKDVRSMGRVAIMSTWATELALKNAGLFGDPVMTGGRAGVAYGSSSGSVNATMDFFSMLTSNVVADVTSSTYIKMMSHTCPVNISVFFKTTGRLIPTGTACTSGSLAIGLSYEAIKEGRQDVMIAGGAEELSPTQAVVFDTLFATSTKNQAPKMTPSQYDAGRDGLVIGEGAGTLILEEYEHARARGAPVYAEVAGFATGTDGTHITQPNSETMAVAIREALRDAGLPPGEIAYVSGHGTATKQGDAAETQATRAVFRRSVPISSLKSYTGHTLGACGAIEAILTVKMLREGWFHPTLNLARVDP